MTSLLTKTPGDRDRTAAFGLTRWRVRLAVSAEARQSRLSRQSTNSQATRVR